MGFGVLIALPAAPDGFFSEWCKEKKKRETTEIEAEKRRERERGREGGRERERQREGERETPRGVKCGVVAVQGERSLAGLLQEQWGGICVAVESARKGREQEG